MTQLKMLSTDDKIGEIRRLYFKTSKQTIQQDLAKALDLLKSMDSEDDRERATVFMEGLAEMQRDWLKGANKGPGKPGGAGGPARPKGSGKPALAKQTGRAARAGKPPAKTTAPKR